MSIQEFDKYNVDDGQIPDITLEEFDAMEGKHIFSEKYNMRKKTLLEAVKRKNGSAKKRMWHMAAAAAIAMLIIPSSVYAANRIYKMFVEKENHQTNIKVQHQEGNQSYVPVEFEASYLPEGSVGMEGDDMKYYVPGDGGSDARSVSFVVDKLDVDEFTFPEKYTTEYQEFSAGGNQAVLVKKDDTFVFDKKIYVVFEDYGYVVSAYLGSGITADEAEKIAGGIILKETDEANAVKAGSLAEALETAGEEEIVSGVDDMNNVWYKIGDKIEEGISGYQITVKKVSVLDNINALEKKYFFNEALKDFAEFIDDSGNLLTYERQNIIYGDGVNSINKFAEPETIQKKMVYVTLEVTNPETNEAGGENELCVNMPINILKENENVVSGIAEPVYFDASITDNNDTHFFYTTLGKGETITCHLGYLVDEDMMGDMYLNSSFDGSANVLTDIRQ